MTLSARLALGIAAGIAMVLLSGPAATAQSQQVFEVASVKRSAPDSHTETRRYPGGRFTATGVTLKALIQRAYDVQDFQIVGGPKWLTSYRYDVEAKASRDVSPEQLNHMIQALLADRFRLTIHRETRNLPIYALTVEKNGPILRKNTKGFGPTWSIGRGLLQGEKISMSVLASDLLEKALGRVVVDHTGVDGDFDIKLTWTPDSPGEKTPDNSLAIESTSIFTSLREQLGLRLDSQTGPVEVVVIDTAEKASEN
jgi:uncharacterized protein (TIGR03435 family)